MSYQETETHITLTCDKCGKVEFASKDEGREKANLVLYMSGWRIKYVDRKDGNHYCGEVCLHALKMVR